MNSILEKIKNVTISNANRISPEDLSFCENRQSLYNLVFDQLTEQHNQFEKLSFEFKEKYNINRSIKKSHRDDYYISSDTSFSNRNDYNEFLFDPTYSSRHTKNLLLKLNNRFISNLKHYFSSKYNIVLDFTKLIESSDISKIDFDQVINFMFDQIGNINLNEKGLKELKTSFNKCTYRRNSKPSLSKSKITLPDFVWYDTRWNEKAEIPYNNESIEILLTAFSYFENENLKPLSLFYNNMPNTRQREVSFSSNYNFELSEKIESVKFFKNNRLDIVFRSEELARTFFYFFELNTEN